MRPVKPDGIDGRHVTFAKDYEPMAAVLTDDGIVWSRWELAPEERQAIADGANVDLAVYTFGKALQPLFLRVQGFGETPVPVDAGDTLRVCVGCGCREYRACPGGCAWIWRDPEDPRRGVCSNCEEDVGVGQR